MALQEKLFREFTEEDLKKLRERARNISLNQQEMYCFGRQDENEGKYISYCKYAFNKTPGCTEDCKFYKITQNKINNFQEDDY